MIHIDAALLAFISGSVIPLVTGAVTKLNAPAGLKAFVSAVLAGAVAVIGYVTDFNGVGTWKQAAAVGFLAWVTHAGSYYGFLKPTGVAPAVQTSTAEVGLG